jgi:transcriptional regulator with XRE-family HTH domain
VLNSLITSDQIRAARALLRWTAKDLAENSGVAVSTIKRLELMSGVPSGQVRILSAIHSAFDGAGVEFIGSPSDAPGVRLRGKGG